MNFLSQNPFNTGSPVRGGGFIGRLPLIGNITRFLKSKDQYNLLIFGQRRIGKTSLLRKLQDIPGLLEIACPVYFNLQDKATTEITALLLEIADKIIRDLELNINIKTDQLKAFKDGTYFQEKFIPQVITQLPGEKQLLLLFDEFDVLNETEDVENDSLVDTFSMKRFIPFMTGLIEELQAKKRLVKFIFAVGRNYKDLEPRRFGQILKFGSQEELSLFTREETWELLTCSDNLIPFTESAREEIYSITFGHPYFTQCLASASYDAAEQKKSPVVTPELVSGQIIPTLKRFSSGIYWIWDSLSASHKTVLYLMALLKEENHPLHYSTIREKAASLSLLPAIDQLEQLLDSLKAFKFIHKQEDGSFDFYVEFIRKWITQEISQSEIERLLDKIDEDMSFHLHNAHHFFKKKEYKSAITHYEEVLRKSPSHLEALLYLGRCYSNLGDEDRYIDNALECFKKAYHLNRLKSRKEYLLLLQKKLTILEKSPPAWDKDETISFILETVLKEIQAVEPGFPGIAAKLAILKKDTDILKELGIKTKKSLVALEFDNVEHRSQNGYALDEHGFVTELILSGIGLVPFPKTALSFKHLKKLALTGTAEMSDISFLKHFQGLTHLDLKGNYIRDISVLNQLTGLVYLDLQHNYIFNIDCLRNLPNLEYLNLSSNDMMNYSPLESCIQLRELDISGNFATDVSFLPLLTHLKYLHLRENWITSTSFILEMENLEMVDLIYNNIIELPAELFEKNLEINISAKWAPKKSGIYLYGNNIKNPPPEIVAQGLTAIRDYFRSLKKEPGTIQINEVKVLLVGDGGTGKTSLLKRLRDEEFKLDEEQTRGIEIHDLPCPASPSHPNGINAHIWDFGGQEIMHASHQFFLSERSLYILLVDGREERNPDYWLNHIRTFGGNSPVLVVINKIDQYQYELDRQTLMTKYPNIKGFYRTSCANKTGIDQFKKALFAELPQTELIQTPIAQSWMDVKNRLEQTTRQSCYINQSRFQKICETCHIPNDSSRQTLINFLNHLGIVLHFNQLEFHDFYVLNPRWVTEAVYRIINSPTLESTHGLLDTAQLDFIINQEKTKTKPYPQEHKGRLYSNQEQLFILQLMERFELCFRLDEKRLLVPGLLSKESPMVDLPLEPRLNFLFRYDFLPKSIIPRLLIRLKNDVILEKCWRQGMLLENHDHKVSALIRADENEKNISIIISGDQKREYLAIIRHGLNEINQGFHQLDFQELIPLPGPGHRTVEYKFLLGYERSGRKEYFDGSTQVIYDVTQLLDSVTLPGKRLDLDQFNPPRFFPASLNPDQSTLEIKKLKQEKEELNSTLQRIQQLETDVKYRQEQLNHFDQQAEKKVKRFYVKAGILTLLLEIMVFILIFIFNISLAELKWATFIIFNIFLATIDYFILAIKGKTFSLSRLRQESLEREKKGIYLSHNFDKTDLENLEKSLAELKKRVIILS